MTSKTSPTPQTRYAGLDGMRAIAVALVVVYHLFPQSWVRGGFIGVDVFFVLSGFLITTLLLRETSTTGRIALGAFWQRRARRLLPALAAVVTVCATAAWFVGGDVLVRLGEQVLGAATFSYNWVSVAGGGGYFSAATPELFRNFWSLAVEEQFYVLWPLVLPLLLLVPRTWGRVAAVLGLAAASAVWMGMVVSSGADLTRAYFGTDTHAFGILLGIALAFVLEPVLARDGGASARVRAATVAGGSAALAGLGLVALVPPSPTAATFPGAVLAASLCSAVAITASVWPGSAFGPALDTRPLRWIGDRSYGIYLWHWPLLVLLVAATLGRRARGRGAGVGRRSGARADHRRRRALVPVHRDARAPLRLPRVAHPPRRAPGRLAGRPAARADRTGRGRAAAGRDLGGDRRRPGGLFRAGGGARRAGCGPGCRGFTGGRLRARTDARRDPRRSVAVADAGRGQRHHGDRRLGHARLGAEALLEELPGIQVDAAVSRSTYAGPGILQSLASSGQLRPYVVIALGTNGPVSADAMEQMAQIAGPERQIVLVDAFAPRDWIPGVNADLDTFAATHPGVVVADWSDAIAGHTDLLAGDQIHPGSAGGRIYADAVAAGVDAAERQRAYTQYDAELRAYRRLHHAELRDAE